MTVKLTAGDRRRIAARKMRPNRDVDIDAILEIDKLQMSIENKARYMVTRAIREGILTPWPCCAMPDCNQRIVQAHHVSYEPKYWLRVIWLCRKCHHQLHVEHRAREVEARRLGLQSSYATNDAKRIETNEINALLNAGPYLAWEWKEGAFAVQFQEGQP
jgi:hypothetical protein